MFDITTLVSMPLQAANVVAKTHGYSVRAVAPGIAQQPLGGAAYPAAAPYAVDAAGMPVAAPGAVVPGTPVAGAPVAGAPVAGAPVVGGVPAAGVPVAGAPVAGAMPVVPQRINVYVDATNIIVGLAEHPQAPNPAAAACW